MTKTKMNNPEGKIEYNNQPLSAQELLAEFEQQEQPLSGELIKFNGLTNQDVYNVTAPFIIDDKVYIAGRVESQETANDSKIYFFESQNGTWQPALNIPALNLEDPFVTKVGQEFILGGVKIAKKESQAEIDYQTEFLRGGNLETFKKFSEGPSHMKDIRVLPLPTAEVAVFTRPQGEIGGKGKIGFTILPNLEALTPANLLKAKIIEGQFRDDEWGGANELHLLKDGRIGVLGHIARFDSENKKHYYAMSFIFDPKTTTATPLKIIATRQNFPLTPAKRSDLNDIVFPGGLVRHNDGTATLYAGLSDTAAGRLTIADPFAGL